MRDKEGVLGTGRGKIKDEETKTVKYMEYSYNYYVFMLVRNKQQDTNRINKPYYKSSK